MPIREFECFPCNVQGEILHASLDPTQVPSPDCPRCSIAMTLMVSLPNLDTSTNFKGVQTYRGPDGRMWNIDSLHKMRSVEHSYQESGYDIRFDAYSAEPSNPDSVDGMGNPYWNGDKNTTLSNRLVVDLKGK